MRMILSIPRLLFTYQNENYVYLLYISYINATTPSLEFLDRVGKKSKKSNKSSKPTSYRMTLSRRFTTLAFALSMSVYLSFLGTSPFLFTEAFFLPLSSTAANHQLGLQSMASSSSLPSSSFTSSSRFLVSSKIKTNSLITPSRSKTSLNSIDPSALATMNNLNIEQFQGTTDLVQTSMTSIITADFADLIEQIYQLVGDTPILAILPTLAGFIGASVIGLFFVWTSQPTLPRDLYSADEEMIGEDI